MKQGVIFDMDGTLWDSAENVAHSWTEALQKKLQQDRVITLQDIQSVMGKPMDEIAHIFFEDEKDPIQVMNVCTDYENEYLAEHGGNLYDGFEQTMTKLKEMGYHLYIVSNCQSGYIEAFLQHYGFGHYFDDIACFGDNNLQKGENIRLVVERNQLGKAVYVGDIQGDYNATMQAGLPFIHAAYGFGTIDTEVPKIQSLYELTERVPEVLG
ncbi:MAG: HAD family hydrolase [Lachnospiraceae bacterium]